MAKWLFSSKVDKNGNPEGIALSCYRFNIGGGTQELGDSSKIKDFPRRVECFLDKNGQYDWSKQSGYLWFVKKAKAMGVKDLIAFSNTPPVWFTQNGLGYKTIDNHISNLKSDKYDAFANFMADVCQHFKKLDLHFNYISPVNEPQWSWYNNDQEGSPWSNEEISHIAHVLNNALIKKKLDTKILMPEAGDLRYLYNSKGNASHQIQQLFQSNSIFDLKKLPTVANIVAGHGYFSDKGDSSRIAIREHLRDSVAKYKTHFWQSEYCMLGDACQEGKAGKVSAFDCAMFLAKVIHDDLTYADATAWQFWNSCEPSPIDSETCYCLISLEKKNDQFTSGKVFANKNLWALGHYSRFIRPGMHRINAIVKDGKTKIQQAQNVMVSAFSSYNKVIIVAINYSERSERYRTSINGISLNKHYDAYITTKDKNVNLQHYKGIISDEGLLLPARSITTFVLHR